MKKLVLTTAIILGFVIGSNAQQNTSGLIKRGGDRMTRDDEAGLFLPGDGLHGIGGNADATDTYYYDNEYDWQSHIVFSSVPSTISGGYWDQIGTWANGEVPENVNVTINGTVTIPADYTASAATVTINPGAQLIIEPGGQLYHSNEVSLTLQLDYESGLTAKDGEPQYGEYRLIASPITPYVTVSSTGLVPDSSDANYNNVDLYMFDQSCGGTTYADGDGKEWRNYKADDEFNTLVNTKGYLYANTEDAFVVFAGQTIATAETSVNLVNDEDALFAGWNLVGNPFTCKAYVDKPFYILAPAGDSIDELFLAMKRISSFP